MIRTLDRSATHSLTYSHHTLLYPQPVLSGMGELHLEMVEERLRRVYGVACELGQLQVAYRETLLDEARATGEVIFSSHLVFK